MTRATDPEPPRAMTKTLSPLAPETDFSSVLIERAPGEVPLEVRRSATRAVRALGDAFTPADAPEPTHSAGRAGEGRQLDELLAPALQSAGYRRVDELTYLANFSTVDVEHTLTFNLSGQSRTWVSGDAALSNAPAATFAQQSYERYANPMMLSTLRQSGYVDPPWFRPMRFSIGMICDWGRLCALDVRRFSPAELGVTMAEAVRTKLVPYVGPITTREALLDFLKRDEEPMRWFRVRALFRAAMIAYLSRWLDVPRELTIARLLERAVFLETDLRNTALSPEEFADRVLDDAAAALAPP